MNTLVCSSRHGLVFFLLGMRGVGKSTWARKHFEDAKLINLLDEALYQLYLSQPEAFREDICNLKAGTWVIVDEIQRLPNLLNEVHRAMEEPKLKFALLGSSARKLRRAGVNLLGGRALQKFMHPFLPSELGDNFSIERVLQYGSIPLIWNAEDPREQILRFVVLVVRQRFH